MKKISNKITTLILGLFILFSVIYMSTFSIISLDKSCSFSSDENCVYEITVPEGLELSNYILDLSFEPEQSNEWETYGKIERLDSKLLTYETDRGGDYELTASLYGIPEEVYNLSSYRVIYTSSGDCVTVNGDEKANSGTYVTDVLFNYRINSIPKCHAADSRDCGDRTRDMLFNDYYSNDLWVLNQKSLPGGENIFCPGTSYGNDVILDYNKEVIVELERKGVYNFLINNNIREKSGGSAHVYPESNVVLEYQRDYYPTNLAYSLNSENVQTLTGEQKVNTQTYNIANIINRACNRSISDAECTVQLNFTSDTIGVLNFDAEDVVYSKVIIDDSVIDIIEPELEKVNFFQRIWNFIKNLF